MLIARYKNPRMTGWPTGVPLGLLFLAWICVCPAASGSEAEQVSGPVAVIALIPPEGDGDLLKLTAQVQQVLTRTQGLEVLAIERLTRALSSGSRSGRANADLERLEGIFKQGYLQSYSFEYGKALSSLHQVVQGLDRLPHSEARWRLWVKTKTFQGIALAGLKKEEAAVKAFAAVLRTRPDLELSRREYAPKTIRLWEKARARLVGLPKGKLAVQSQPAGADVFVDGVQVGRTPFIGQFAEGYYLVYLVHADTGGASRWVALGDAPARVRMQLGFEGCLVLDGEHPAVRLGKGETRLAARWWPWLGVRLGIRMLVVVGRRSVEGRSRLVASLVDLERGRALREGWLDSEAGQVDQLSSIAADFARFLVTGRAGERLRVSDLPNVAERNLGPPPPGTRVPDLPIRFAPRPWYRHWWPYAVAGGLMLGGGLGSHLASDHYDRQAANSTNRATIDEADRKAGAYLGGAIAGYALAGAALATSLIVHLTFEPQEVYGHTAVVPLAAGDGFGLGLVGRF
jgi:hypothetical protein